MMNAYDLYKKLNPQKLNWQIPVYLKEVHCYFFPEDLNSIKVKDLNKKNTVILYKEKNKNIVNFIVSGFEHIICLEREDVAQEIMVAALMINKPRIFVNDPTAFFFNDFNPEAGPISRRDNNLTVAVSSTKQKDQALDLLRAFWAQRTSMESLEDVCLQIADEMFTNAFFNAPVEDGVYLFKNSPREKHITLPDHLKPRLFTCFNKHMVFVGCLDFFGSIVREPIMYRLESLYTEAMTAPREHTSGAGLGFKFLIDNSANFYVFSEKGKQTLFACGLALKGMKANHVLRKNIHFAV